jgi:chromosome segregation ATPase
LLVTRLNNADGLHAKEIHSMEAAFAARTLQMSSRLVETTANLERAQEELELLRKERQSAAEVLEREREAVEKWKAESEMKIGKLEGRVRALESALEEKQDELKVRHQHVAILLTSSWFRPQRVGTLC